MTIEKKSKFSEFKKKQKNFLFRMSRQVKKEFKLLWTDKFNIFLALILPPLIILLIAFTSSSSDEISPIKCTVVSNDSVSFLNPNNYTESYENEYAIPFIRAINKSEYLNPTIHDDEIFYNVTNEPYAMEEARALLRNGEIKAIIVIPNFFTEMLKLGLPGIVDCIVDASKMLQIQKNLNAVQDAVTLFINDTNLKPQIDIQSIELFSLPEDLNFEFNYMLNLILPIMSFGLALVLTILVVVKEKPIARLLLTPVQRFEILLSKYITYGCMIAAQTAILIISSIAQGLYCVGSFFDIYLAVFMLGFVGMGLGLFISSVSKTKTEANQYFFMFFIVIIILSGMFIPIDSMPFYLQIFAWILPLSHADPMISGVLSKGNSVFGFDFYCLLALAIVLVLISFYIFNKKQYEA